MIEHVGSDMFVIDKVCFSYDVNPIFDGFNLDVAPGELLSIIGPSGCGKTTLLNLLSGYLPPGSGSGGGSVKTRSDPVPLAH